jgi:hypothetical protein
MMVLEASMHGFELPTAWTVPAEADTFSGDFFSKIFYFALADQGRFLLE